MSRPNLQIKVGSYTGDGTDNRNITGIGFRPDFIIIKGGARNACFRTKHVFGDATPVLATNAANTANIIQETLNDGFQLGTSTNANEGAVKFYYIAIRGTSAQKYFKVGQYVGSGADDRDFTVGGIPFTPDFVITKGNNAQLGAFRITAHSGDTASRFSANSNAADTIQNLQTNGFQLGTTVGVNESAIYFTFMAMKHLSGTFITGGYTGDGTASRAITGLGFKPDWVMVKTNSANAPRLLTTDMVTDGATSLYMNTTATDATGVLTLDSDGFTVGASDSVNKSAALCYYVAFKSGDFNAPIVRTAA